MDTTKLVHAIKAAIKEAACRSKQSSSIAIFAPDVVPELLQKTAVSKFVQDAPFEMTLDNVDAMQAGLTGKLGAPAPDVFEQMEREHTGANSQFADAQFEYEDPCGKECYKGKTFTTTARKEWKIAIEGSHDKSILGPRDCVRPLKQVIADNEDKMKDEDGKLMPDENKRLTKEEVLAGVLWSGPMFKLYNGVLRFMDGEDAARVSFPVPDADAAARKRANCPTPLQNANLSGEFVTTIHAINSLVIVQSRRQKAQKIWRGVGAGKLPGNCSQRVYLFPLIVWCFRQVLAAQR